jgi:diadenosine tetraphosphate (Ap4A) HIT family hydrolase
MDTQFAKRFQLEDLTIEIIGPWIISLRPQQPTIGSLVLTLNRECERFGEISEHEATYLSRAFRQVELLLKKTFNPPKINYLALMMVDNQVHYHIIPRYENPVLLAGKEYFDKNWPKPPSLEPTDISHDDIRSIYRLFKNISDKRTE